MIKTTGAEWKAFHADNAYWGEFYVEDEVVAVNGGQVDRCEFDVGSLSDSDRVTVDGGWVADQAAGSDKEYSLDTFFRRWRKQQTTDYLSVEVPKDKAEVVRAAIVAAGGKVK